MIRGVSGSRGYFFMGQIQGFYVIVRLQQNDFQSDCIFALCYLPLTISKQPKKKKNPVLGLPRVHSLKSEL